MNRLLIILIINLLISPSYSQETKLNRKNFTDFNNLYYSSLYVDQTLNSINEMLYLITIWVEVDKLPDTPDKLKLKNFQYSIIPDLLNKLDLLSTKWSPYSKNRLETIKLMIDTLNVKHEYIMGQLKSFESYEDMFIIFEITPMIEYGGDLNIYNRQIQNELSVLKTHFTQKLSKYLLPFYDENANSVIDIKLLAVETFILKYGLEKYSIDENKKEYIYNFYTMDELSIALDDALPKGRQFYEKYNKLLLEINK